MQTLPAGAFTEEQAERGRTVYASQCASCHGGSLEGIEAPALKGSDTMQNFGSASALFGYFAVSMPPNAPGQLGDETYVDILAHILQVNGAEPDGTELTSDQATLAAINLAQLSGGSAAAPAPEAAADSSPVPQAFTFGEQLPAVGGAETPAASTSGVPQAFTFGTTLPAAN